MWLMRKYKILNIYSINFKHQVCIIKSINDGGNEYVLYYNYEGDINQMTIIF